MADPHRDRNPTSPISQLLHTLGMTREDLSRHSEQMRQFLTTDPASPLYAAAKQPGTLDSVSTRAVLRGRSRPASFLNASFVAQSPTPPTTPVKTEPLEGSLPRQLDTMQLVIERKSKKDKIIRRDSNAHSRDGRRVQPPKESTPLRSTTPQTPHHYRYYSDRVVSEASSSHRVLEKSSEHAVLPRTPRNPSRSYTHFKVPEPRNDLPQTPSGRHIYSRPARNSSRASTPCSSPPRIVNVVSSPGPMRPAPLSEDEDEFPYVLPPGPYSAAKPDLSYAAMIGQAILSSPQHGLTLQDIYEWITTVYPHYKRGEQTWMNSVRHALSTMAVFRKVPRGRAEGKSLWAIWDCDIPCFAGGGFRKSLCADMAKPEAPGKPGPRKRGTMEETLARKAKRQKRTSKKTEEDQFNVIQQMPSVMPAPILPPFFPTFHANPHHQPYYQAYPHRPLSTPQPLPAEVIFPPLPPSSNYHRLAALSAPAAFSTSRPETRESVGRSHSSSQEMEEELLIDHACFADPLSSSSMPDLASNLSSSSSPPPSSSTSLLGLDSRGPSPDFTSGSELQYPADSQDGTDEWLSSVPSVEALEPSITLLQRLSTKKSKGKTKQSDPKKTRYQRAMSPPIPQSPTLERQAAADSRRKQSTISEPSTPPRKVVELSAPPVTPQRPSTPRRRAKGTSGGLQLSSHRTPISHKGLHMSPSPSLAYYKSHLDPPPVAMFLPQAPLLSAPEDDSLPAMPLGTSEALRTPSRKSAASGSRLTKPSPFAPVTPKKLVFPNGGSDSPFRTPTRSIFDPHDPGALLDDELSRLCNRESDLLESPTGLFGRNRTLLYESPGMPDGRWERYW